MDTCYRRCCVVRTTANFCPPVPWTRRDPATEVSLRAQITSGKRLVETNRETDPRSGRSRKRVGQQGRSSNSQPGPPKIGSCPNQPSYISPPGRPLEVNQTIDTRFDGDGAYVTFGDLEIR